MDKQIVAAELKTAYNESVHRTNRFIISTLTILLILVIIIQQELLSIKSHEKKLRRAVINNTERLHQCTKSLVAQFPQLTPLLEQLSQKEDFRDQADDFLNLPKNKEFLANDIGKIEILQRDISIHLRKEAAQDNKNRNKPLIVLLEEITRLIKPYKKDYQDCVKFQQNTQSKRKELLNMRMEKRSIPTPFGDFQVHPKLALLALAFAAILTYLSFCTSVIKLRILARDYSVLNSEQENLLDRSPPFWLYGKGSDILLLCLGKQNESKILQITSFVLHVGWLIFAGWLIDQSLTWKSSGVLLSEYKYIASYLLLIFFGLAILLATIHFVPWPSKDFLLNIKPESGILGKNFNRRKFISLSIAGLIVGTASYFGLKPVFQRSKQCALKFDSTLFNRYPTDFIGNLKSQVIHHRIACRRHLPKPKNQFQYAGSQAEVCFHADYRSSILAELAKTDITRQHYALAVSQLVQAINISPFSYHLYDSLINVYGRLRQYDEIEKLIHGALQRLQELEQQASPQKERKQLPTKKQIQRARKEFNLRLKTFNERINIK